MLFELAKNLVKNGEDPALVEKRVGTMERYFADALVTGYDDLVLHHLVGRRQRHEAPRSHLLVGNSPHWIVW
ncbi:hypothetical protein [Herbiconiux liukaitaii]|uniref:hypothetical protein n=1 Tax=Herbiconiux liukaitaii TaxID=3342799 RepID=UPI0035B9A0F2